MWCRFIETANETLDEKIDMLKNQEKMLTALNERARKFLHEYARTSVCRRLALIFLCSYAVEKKPPPPLLTVHKRANSDRWRASHKPTSNGTPAPPRVLMLALTGAAGNGDDDEDGSDGGASMRCALVPAPSYATHMVCLAWRRACRWRRARMTRSWKSARFWRA